jgi:PAS domain S-box-containing protein
LEGGFHGLVQRLDAIILQADAETLGCTFVNQRVQSVLGYTVESWLKEPDAWIGRLHPDDREGTLALCMAAGIDGRDRQSVHRAIAADGRVLWFRTSFHGEPAPDGGAGQVVAMMIDISEAMKTASSVEEADGHARLVLEELPLLLWTTDRNLKYTSSTGAGLAKLGLRPYQLNGVSVWAYFQTDDPHHQHIVAHRRALAGETVTYDAEWGARTFQNHLEPIHDADGAVVGAIGVALDITERKQVERERDRLLLEERAARAASEEAHARAAYLADASVILSSSLDYEATLASVARLAVPRLGDAALVDMAEPGAAIRRMVAHAGEPPLEPLCRELMGITPDAASPEGVARVLGGGRSVCYVDLGGLHPRIDRGQPVPSPDDPALPLLVRAGVSCALIVPLFARGKTIGALTFLRAVPDGHFSADEVLLAEELGRRAGMSIDNARLYQEAREAVRLREEFLSVASHELRTPVTSLLLGLQSVQALVKEGSLARLPPSHVARVIDASGRQASRLADLVDALLDVSRIQAGRFGLTIDVVDLTAVAREVIARLEPDRVRANAPLELHADGAVMGRWDRSRIDQVVTNLLSNALKFGGGKPIELWVGGDGETATLTVRDRGIGIPAERLERVFEIFERAVSARNYGGLGLGLYIVRRIVEAHNGNVSVQSELGTGSSFTVSLPRRGPQGSAL